MRDLPKRGFRPPKSKRRLESPKPEFRRSRPKLPAVSEEMKAWSAALKTELSAWPDVNSRPMFGLTALYRRRRIFAVLPKTRGLESPNSVAFRLADPSPPMLARLRKEPRIINPVTETHRWFSFEISSDLDLRDALRWLTLAYEAAR